MDGQKATAPAEASQEGQQGVEYHPPTESTGERAAGAEPVASGGVTVSAAPAPAGASATPTSEATYVLGRRVDWLTTAFRVALSEGILRALSRALDAADEAGRTAVDLAGGRWELRHMRSGKRLLLRNADIAVVIDPQGPEGWTVQVEHPGATMMRTELDRAVQQAEAIAASLGDVQGSRVRRLDLAADIGGWSVGDIDDRAWVKSSRAKLERARGVEVDKSDSPVQRRFRRGERVTGYSICPGNALMAVVYDKREELTLRPEKTAAEESRWREQGWDGAAPVTRVEFRFRSLVLHELGCRDGLVAFRKKLDALWGYATRWWIRLVELGAATRLSRCPVTPEWRTVQAVRFEHWATPAVRKKMRQGASPAQVFGAALSAVAGAGLLLAPVISRCEEIPSIVSRMSEAERETTVRAMVGGIVAEAGGLVVVDLLERLGTERAARWVLQRQEAARGRFSSLPGPVAAEVAA